MATHPPYLHISPLPMRTPFPLPPANIPQSPLLRTSAATVPHPVPVQIHGPLVPTFRAPAHRHAHHLHSIPPREKSTRTLIIDHMLWVHTRTRFAQARAELGMTDRTGGPSSPYHTHRRRPENYDEEDEALSEGEDILFLKSRTGWTEPTQDDDDHTSKQDLALARGLRLRAEGLESVISSMLDQPPPHHSLNDNDSSGPQPTSPKAVRTGSHPHTLPNGVRLRLALGTVVNDLFARQAPPQPYRHTHPPKPHEEAHPHQPHRSIPDLPETLIPLIPLSGAFSAINEVARSSTTSVPYNPASAYRTGPIGSTNSHPHLQPCPTPSTRALSYYMSGADPSTANSPPSLRCPRHLHTGCEICVEARSTPRPSAGRTHANQHQQSKPGSSPGSSASTQWKVGSTSGTDGNISGWQDGSGIGSGLLRPGIKGSALRRRVYDDANDKRDKNTGAGNTKLSELIPRFLRLSALVAVELGQEARDDAEWESSGNPASTPSPVGSRAIPPTHPKGKQRDERDEDKNMSDNALRPTREWYMLLAGLLTRAVLEGYLSAGWRGIKSAECLLMVGVGIGNSPAAAGAGGRAQRTGGDVGNEGARMKGPVDRTDDNKDNDGGSEVFGDEEEFKEFDPDGLPSLAQAVRVLFPSLKVGTDAPVTSAGRGGQPKLGQAEAEYEAEMCGRLRRFYDIPESTPDLSTHMEDLAWSYPAEPVERAAVRFCEAVAKWRGKPELETYKKKSPSSPGMSINSLVHSSPSSPVLSNAVTGTPYSLTSLGSMLGRPSPQAQTAPTPQQPRRPALKPSIDVYFSGVTSRVGTKRGRDEREGEGREEGVKRVHM